MNLSKQQFDSLADYIRNTITEKYCLPEEFSYENSVMIILDAILSKRRNYSYVKSKIDFFKENHSDIDSLEKLVEVIEKEKVIGFHKYIDWNCQEKIKEICELSKVFLEIKKEGNYTSDLDAMKNWAKTAKLGDEVSSVHGIGIETFQYLKMLLGVETSRPTKCILDFLNHALQTSPSKKEAIEIIEKVSRKLGTTPRILDYSIWSHNDSERWSDIENYEDIFQVSDLGNIRKYDEDNSWWIYKATGENGKYLKCELSRRGNRNSVHRLVAKAFMPIVNSKDMQVDHKDEDPHNNRLKNLQWVTPKENKKLTEVRKKLRNEIENTLNGTNRSLTYSKIKQLIRNSRCIEFADTAIFNFDEQFEIAYRKVTA